MWQFYVNKDYAAEYEPCQELGWFLDSLHHLHMLENHSGTIHHDKNLAIGPIRLAKTPPWRASHLVMGSIHSMCWLILWLMCLFLIQSSQLNCVYHWCLRLSLGHTNAFFWHVPLLNIDVMRNLLCNFIRTNQTNIWKYCDKLVFLFGGKSMKYLSPSRWDSELITRQWMHYDSMKKLQPTLLRMYEHVYEWFQMRQKGSGDLIDEKT